ncbi:hypothetical protein SMICM17S_11130 [Streptomyces microflavus]
MTGLVLRPVLVVWGRRSPVSWARVWRPESSELGVCGDAVTVQVGRSGSGPAQMVQVCRVWLGRSAAKASKRTPASPVGDIQRIQRPSTECFQPASGERLGGSGDGLLVNRGTDRGVRVVAVGQVAQQFLKHRSGGGAGCGRTHMRSETGVS